MTRRTPTPAARAPRGGGSVEQVQRLLTLVPWLHAEGALSIDEAADRLGVTPQQVVRDLKVLLMVGLPGGYPDDLIDVDLEAIEGPEAEGVIRISNADYLARPLQLTATEATALIVALRAVRTSADPGTTAVVDRTLAKLEAAAAASPVVEQVDVAGEPDHDLAELRDRLHRAVSEGVQVRLTYYVPTRDEESTRVVDPHRLFHQAGHDYLDAWCHSAEAPRLFRLDRIHHAAVLDSAVQRRLEPDEQASRTLFDLGEAAEVVTLRLTPEAFWITEYYPVEEVRTAAAGDWEVRLRVADPQWIRRLLLRLAPHATVLAPAHYATEFTAEAERALRLYQPAAYDDSEGSPPT